MLRLDHLVTAGVSKRRMRLPVLDLLPPSVETPRRGTQAVVAKQIQHLLHRNLGIAGNSPMRRNVLTERRAVHVDVNYLPGGSELVQGSGAAVVKAGPAAEAGARLGIRELRNIRAKHSQHS